MRCFVLCIAIMVAAVACLGAGPDTGSILCAYWRELDGTRITDLTDSPSYPNFPHEQVMLDKLEIPANQEANFGTVIRGFVHPPTTGLYRFFIAANHQAELWLSTDADSSRIRIIASVPAWSMPRDWNATPQQQSQPIELNASARYYIEVRHKNGGGDNHLAVAWQLPDGTMEAPIPKERLSPAAPVNVPGPAVHWHELPQGAGVHDVLGTADYLGRTFPLSFGVRIPESGARALPAMALLPGLGQTSWPPLPPDRRPFVEIMPRLSPEQSYSQRATIACISAAIDDLCRRYPVDLKQVGMVGVNDGATAVWPVAAKAGELFRGVATIGSGEYRDPQLKDLLRGTRVKIITDIREGIQTDCAHRMNALLEGLDPKPEIVFLGEKELGAGTGADYCLRQAGFYDSVLGTQQSQPAGAPHSGRVPLGIGAALVILGGVYFGYRYRRRWASRNESHAKGVSDQ